MPTVQHEVKPVTDGYRIALTYNLILKSLKNTIALPVAGKMCKEEKHKNIVENKVANCLMLLLLLLH